MTQPNSWVHLNGNLLAAVDIETNGAVAGYHEIIQIAIVPLTSDIRVNKDIEPFYFTIKPQYPERSDSIATAIHGLDLNYLMTHGVEKDDAADWLEEWFMALKLPENKRLVPLCHNFFCESSFLSAWLGLDHFQYFFSHQFRDTMLTANYLNDRATFAGYSVPFPSKGLQSMCRVLGITNSSEHDALADAEATAEVYRLQVTKDLFEICLDI